MKTFAISVAAIFVGGALLLIARQAVAASPPDEPVVRKAARMATAPWPGTLGEFDRWMSNGAPIYGGR